MKKLFKANTFDNKVDLNWQINLQQIREIKKEIALIYNYYDISEEDIDLICMALYRLKYIKLFDGAPDVKI